MDKSIRTTPGASADHLGLAPGLWIPRRRRALKIALAYGMVGALWIFCSGWLLHHFVHNESLEALIENVKGWFFVITTALLLWFFLDRYFREIRDSAWQLQESEARLRMASDNLPDSYVYQYQHAADGTPRFTYVSAGVEHVHGVTGEVVLRDANALISLTDPAHLPALAAAEAESKIKLTDFEMELPMRHADGSPRLLHLRGRPRLLPEGVVQWDGFATDITDRRRAEEELRTREQLLQMMGRTAKVGGWQLDPATSTGTLTDEVARIHDLPFGAQPNREMALAFYVGESRERITTALQEAIEHGTPYDLLLEFASATGVHKWIRTICQPVLKAGKVVQLQGTLQDVTDQVRTEASLRVSEERFRTLVENAPIGIFIQVDLKFVYANQAAARMLGPALLGDALVGTSVLERIHVDYRAKVSERIRILNDERQAVPQAEQVCVRLDGSTFAAAFSAVPFVFNDRPGALVFFQDVTDRQRAEAALQEREQMLRLFVQHSPAAIAMVDREMRYLVASNRWLSDHRIADPNIIGRSYYDVFPNLPASWKLVHQRCLAGATEKSEGDVMLRPDGVLDWVRWEVRPWRTAHGELGGLLMFSEVITQRREAEISLRRSEERFRELAETIQEVFWITSPDKEVLFYVSPAYKTVWGGSCESLYANPQAWLESIHAEDRERVARAAATKQISGGYDEEYRIIRPDGCTRWIRDRAFPVRNDDRRVERIVGLAQDITERKELESQLRQSQKMDAIGQLAGGVAHDFNNILAAIMMQAALLDLEELSPESREGLREISAAAERAANLTRQLLLFSRRQLMQARSLDLNDSVTNLARMLQRIIGEDVRLQINLHPHPLITRADAGMLDQLLMNLAVNARDAMPNGGRLIIETSTAMVDDSLARLFPDAKPGNYVCLRVNDTGVGIPPEIMPRIFEPFFTTKEPGKGTGLGLATVFGIIKQHHGWLKVYSEPGQGTGFQIFLPAADTAPTPGSDTEKNGLIRGGTETILLVEDEAMVRTLTRALLERNGYTVIEAPNGVEAMRLWPIYRNSIALLLTDLIMPGGMSGPQLVQKLQAEGNFPKAIFMSGYSAEMAGRDLDLRTGENFLQKPFGPDRLLVAIRKCLDEQLN